MTASSPVRLFLISAALLLGATGGVVLGEPLPTASEVAGNVGQSVEFQDAIKAVSYSRSTKGYYFSFGAPYPKQVLSVWVSDEVHEHLPGKSTLVGRTVRIKGQLTSSPTGPMLNLNSVEQFQLLPADETILSRLILDGKKDRDQFAATASQYFWRDEFSLLEQLANELRVSKERFSDGTWLLDAYFRAFHLPASSPDERFVALEQKIARWESAYPNSHVVAIVKAEFHVELGWKIRDAQKDREKFKRELAIAREILDRNTGAKIYPEYFAVMQTIALGERWPRQAYMSLFSEAINAEPEYYRFYFHTAQYLLPGWSGRKGDWEEFANQQRLRRGPGGEGDALYARIAWAMKTFYKDIFRETAVSWEIMASGFEYLIRQYPSSNYLKNAYANFAWRADDRMRLRKALAEIKGEPDMTIWVNLENVQTAQDFANNVAPGPRTH